MTVSPDDFPNREAAWEYLVERIASFEEKFKELEHDMVLLTEGVTPLEARRIGYKWEITAAEMQEGAK